jgi:F-type H+-transporting ATPase subunit a
VPILFPFKVLEYVIKPASLCLRLFGNILAAFTIMELIYFAVKSFVGLVVPAFLPAFFSVYFDLFDGLLQAYIFSFLTCLYIGEAIEEEEDEEHEKTH